MSTFAEGYIDVAERIAAFRELYPTGSLQPADPARPYRIETIGDQIHIVYGAAAYRTPDDVRPGIGYAYEPYPGRTPYTRGSELQNAETSAWGRAIVAALAADTKRGIASAQEVRNRQADRDRDADAAQDGPRRAQRSRPRTPPADEWSTPPVPPDEQVPMAPATAIDPATGEVAMDQLASSLTDAMVACDSLSDLTELGTQIRQATAELRADEITHLRAVYAQRQTALREAAS